MPYVATVVRRWSGRRLAVLGAVLGLAVMPALALSCAGAADAATGGASSRSVSVTRSSATPPASSATLSAATVSVDALRTTGARVDVTVHRIRTSGQARWVDHVVDERLTSTEGCLADPSDSTRRGSTYRVHVNLLCGGGNADVRQAVADLQAGRPWYRMRVTPVPVVAFQFLADLDHGTGDPVGAALRYLPFGDFTVVDGDDVSLTYVGTGVTQADLDAARSAFALALHLPVSRVAVTPLSWG
jgi:hypothetical protein